MVDTSFFDSSTQKKITTVQKLFDMWEKRVDLVKHIITGDETWIHYSTSETKQ